MEEKFPCLNYLRLALIVACKVVISCATIHNIELQFNKMPIENYNTVDEPIV